MAQTPNAQNSASVLMDGKVGFFSLQFESGTETITGWVMSFVVLVSLPSVRFNHALFTVKIRIRKQLDHL